MSDQHFMTGRLCRQLAAALLAATLLGDSALGASPDRRPAPRMHTAADPQIDEANAAWLAAMQRADTATLAAPYADDGLFVTTQGEVIRGREAVRQLYATRLGSLTRIVSGDIVSDGRVQVRDDLVYEWGHASLMVLKKDGVRSTGGGPYLTVWRRSGSDHQWRIVRNIVF